jgi:hypothetical protein
MYSIERVATLPLLTLASITFGRPVDATKDINESWCDCVREEEYYEVASQQMNPCGKCRNTVRRMQGLKW